MEFSETKTWDTPDEKRLASLMKSASEKLIPQEGYSLELNIHGVMPDRPTFRDLENRFGFFLDNERGSELKLGLEDDSHSLELRHLTAQMADNVGQVDLQRIIPSRTLPYHYMPEVEFRGDRVEASRFAWDSRWQDGLEKRLTQGHGLDTELSPIHTAEDFRMRIGHNILSSCRSWFLQEKLPLQQHILGEEVVRISIVRQQSVSDHTPTSSESLAIVHETETISSDRPVMVSRQRLQLVTHPGEPRFMVTSYKEGRPSRTTDNRQACYRHAETDDINEFISLVSPVLQID